MHSDPSASTLAPEAPESLFNAPLMHLARMHANDGRPLRFILQEFCETVSEALRVNRVSIWVYFDSHRGIRCDFLYQPGQREVFEGAVLNTRDFPEYFRALDKQRALPVLDMENDPFAREFRDAYFTPLGISSMLDATIFRNGKPSGILCHEQVGPARHWSAADAAFAAAASETLARLYAEAERSRAEDALGTYESHLMDLQRMGSLGRLAAGMAHDFRNVLATVSGYAELLSTLAEDRENAKIWIQGLFTAVEQGSRLTRELLRLGRGDTSKPAVLDLQEVIEKCRGVLLTAIRPGIVLKFSFIPPVSRVLMDPLQFERVLLNLVVNARDAISGQGEITVSLQETERKDPERMGLHVLLEVKDTGSGMDEDTAARIFEPFFSTKGEKGTGLGLSIVQQIVGLAGGFVEVITQVGAGTAIRVFLPRIGAL